MTESFEEFIIKFLNGDLRTFRRWFNPKTNSEWRKTRAAEKILDEMPSLESAIHSKKKWAHRKRHTLKLGKRLRGEAERKNSQKKD